MDRNIEIAVLQEQVSILRRAFREMTIVLWASTPDRLIRDALAESIAPLNDKGLWEGLWEEN